MKSDSIQLYTALNHLKVTFPGQSVYESSLMTVGDTIPQNQNQLTDNLLPESQLSKASLTLQVHDRIGMEVRHAL